MDLETALQPPDPTDDLAAVLDDAWDRLVVAADSARHGFHLPAVATVDRGGRPDARVVVLRDADPDARAVACHTDRRSPKVDALVQRPTAAWVFYDPSCKVQLRLTGRTEVHTNGELADARWSASTPSSRRCYLAPLPPGVLAEHPSPNLPEPARGRVPDEPELEPGRAHFAVLVTRADTIDWLSLHHAGHRRARFTWDDQGQLASTWLEV